MKYLLVVEDNPNFAFIIKTLVERSVENVTVLTAYNSTEALRICEDHNIELFFMDIHLSEDNMNGIDLMKKIRKSDTYEDIPFIAITAYASREDVAKFVEEGFDEFIPKPIDKDLLIAMVKKYISDT